MKKFFFIGFLIIAGHRLTAQDSLLRAISDSLTTTSQTEYVTGTFKALYIVNMKTIEAPAAGALNFEIQHRFGTINKGAYDLFGLDFATFRLSLDYGISNRVSVGIGRSTNLKTFDGYLKYKLLRQTENAGMPVSVDLLGTASYFTEHYAGKDTILIPLTNAYRLNYTAQILIARKFNRNLSLEIIPTFIHYNLVETNADQNNVFALATGGRMKITRRMAITAEYDILFPNQLVAYNGQSLHNSFSLGWDIETGGHVFQLIFTNSQSMVESQYIGQTTGTWGNGDIYFGFNISRNFNLKPHK